jgi:spore coat protein H
VAQEPDISYMPALDNTGEANVLAEFDAELARLPAQVEAQYQDYLATIERPMPMFMSARVEATDVIFEWDESFDLQGDGLTYDLQVSTTPTFDGGTIVHSQTGLTITSVAVAKATFGSGEFFFRVIARDTKDPANNWQIAFESYYDSFGVAHHGVVRLVLP